MTDLPPLYILRHGETAWNVEGRLQGRFDAPLTATGIAQAKAQRRLLQQQSVSGYQAICSPQGRARQTAQIALDGQISTWRIDPALREIGLGDWAGQLRADVMAQSGARDGFEVYERAPGGEGFEALHVRCRRFLAGLDQPAILITHGITSRMLRLIALGRPLSALCEMEGGQGVVFRIEDGKQTRLAEGA